MAPLLYGVSSYSVFVALALFVGVGTTIYTGRRTGLPPRHLLLAEASIVLCALIGGQLFSALETGLRWRWALDLSVLKMRYPGGILGALFGLVIATRWLRISLASFGDCVAIGAAMAMT